MATLLFVNSFRISTCREKNLGRYYEAEVGRREAEEPTIDDLVRYIEGDTQTSSNKKKKSNKAKGRVQKKKKKKCGIFHILTGGGGKIG